LYRESAPDHYKIRIRLTVLLKGGAIPVDLVKYFVTIPSTLRSSSPEAVITVSISSEQPIVCTDPQEQGKNPNIHPPPTLYITRIKAPSSPVLPQSSKKPAQTLW